MILPIPRPEPLQRLIEVGLICTQWAYLEYLLANAIWWLCGIDQEKGKILTGKLHMQALIDKAIKLSKSDEHKELNHFFVEISKELNDSKNLIERRNTAIHGVFSSSPIHSGVMVERHKKEDERDRKSYPITELSSLSEDLINLNKRIGAIFMAIGINVH